MVSCETPYSRARDRSDSPDTTHAATIDHDDTGSAYLAGEAKRRDRPAGRRWKYATSR